MSHEPVDVILCAECREDWPCAAEEARRKRENRLRNNAAGAVDAWWARR